MPVLDPQGYWSTYQTGEHYSALTHEQQLYNANKQARYFLQRGWTKQAIAAMVGNQWTESRLNPYAAGGAPANRFGLNQWYTSGAERPDYKNKLQLRAQAIGQGTTWRMGGTQTHVIQWQHKNQIQWQYRPVTDPLVTDPRYIAANVPMTFDQWTKKTDEPDVLAYLFWSHYQISAQFVGQGRDSHALQFYGQMDFKYFPTILLLKPKSLIERMLHR